MTSLRIGCLGWGSLLWDPRTLPMAGDFRVHGPRLPIEFSRVSLDGRVTLVIDPTAPECPTACAVLAVSSLEAAVEGLGLRERISPDRWSSWVGLETRDAGGLVTGETPPSIRETIAAWLAGSGLDAVLWTALPARAPEGEGLHPDTDRLLDHLDSLEGEALARAEEYIRRAPAFVRTPRRARFEETLGWHPLEAASASRATTREGVED